MNNHNQYLPPTKLLAADDPRIIAFAKEAVVNCSTDKEKAIALYYAVRDNWLYDPYNLDISREGLKVTNLFDKRRAWCVEKAAFYVACARALEIPARPGYAIVINHIGTEKLADVLQRDEIVFHGYADIFIDGKWVKCTPAFDRKICRISKATPLEFDGENDSLFQPFEGDDQFMEYVHDYGTFPDIPVEKMNEEMRKYYPHLFGGKYNKSLFQFNFEKN